MKTQKDFHQPVLDILRKLGGEASLQEICKGFLATYEKELTPDFFTDVKDGDVKWRDLVNRAGFHLRKQGLIKSSSKGVWKLVVNIQAK